MSAHIHPLSLSDADNTPFSPVSFSGANWTGTLDASRLPASVPVLVGGNLNVPGSVTATVFVGGGASLTGLNASNLTSGTVPLGRLPASVAGGLNYVGTWNASTNAPTISSGTAGTGQATGSYYVVATAGTTTVDGVSVWNIGDWIVFDGARWDKLDGSANPVSSVAGRTGAVTLGVADVSGAAALTGATFSGPVSLPSGSSVVGYAPLSGAAFTGPISGTRFTGILSSSGFGGDVVDINGNFVGKAINLLSTSGASIFVNGPVTGKTGLFSTTTLGVWTSTGPTSQPDLGNTIPSNTQLYQLFMQYGLCKYYSF